MLDKLKSVAKNSIIYSIGNLSTKLVGFILVPLYTSHFSTSLYGIVGIVDVTSVAIASIFNLGLYYAFFRWYWDKDYITKQKSIFFTSMITLIIVSILMILVFLPFRDGISQMIFNAKENPFLSPEEYSYLTLLMLITAGFQIITIMPATLMRLQEKAFLYTLTNIARLVVTLVLTVYFIVYLKKGVEGIYEAQVIGHIVYFLTIPVYLLRNIHFKFERKILIGMLKFSSPMVLTSISAIVISLADRYLMLYFNGLTGLSDNGIYALGQKITNTINVFVVTSINLAVSPILYKMMNDPGNKRFYSKMMTYSTIVVMFFVISLSVFGMEVIKVLAKNPQYWPAYKVIPFISFAILFNLMRDNAVLGLNILKKTKIVAAIFIVTSISNVVFNIILIPYMNFIGASIAFFISQLVCFLLIYRYAQKYYYIPYEVPKLFKMIMISAALIIISMTISNFDIIFRLVLKSILIISFPVILYLFNFYDSVEILRFKQFWSKWKNPFNMRKNNF